MTIANKDETLPGDIGHVAPDPSATKEPATDLQQQLSALGDLDTAALKKLWQRSHRRVLPQALSRDLIIRMTACKLQEKALGGLTGTLKRKLRLLAEQAEAGGGKGLPGEAISLKPGTKLVRSWHDRTHTVAVLEDGFEYDGKRYASLSRIACEITGAHWSGPRFFGLGPKPKLPPRGVRAAPEPELDPGEGARS